jgi:hypothetical protein
MQEDRLGTMPLSEWNFCPVARALSGTEFSMGFYEPAHRDTFDARIGVAFMPFQWDDDAPWIWLLASVGLSMLSQRVPSTPIRTVAASARIELCTAVREPPGFEAFRDAWRAGELHEFGSVPTLIARFALVAHDFASWIKGGDTFALGDHVQDACLWQGFRSTLLIPPLAELVQSGVAPFDEQGQFASVDNWADVEELRGREGLYLHLAPLTHEEYEVAKWNGLSFFANALLATDKEIERGLDASVHIVDYERASRHALGGEPID